MRRLIKYFPWLILAFTVLFNSWFLLPELAARAPEFNDNNFHYSLCVSMNREFESGGDPLDHWVPYWSFGFPVFHHYQHLPHLIVVLTYRLLWQKLSLFFVFHLYNFLLLAAFPVILYYSLRRMRFLRLEAACAALFSLTLNCSGGYGFELGSFLWGGFGIFSQLWAMCLLPLALSSVYRTLEDDKHYFLSVILLFALANSQVMFGFTALLTSLIFLFVRWERAEIVKRAKRLGLVLAFFFLLIAYFLVPILLDSPYHAHSSYDFPEKWDSYGALPVITRFLNGDLLDAGRLPVATVATAAALLLALSRRAFKYRFAAAGFLLWFLLYFGRPAWGWLIDLLPLASALHLHRFVAMVHFFSLVLLGVGLAALFTFTRKHFKFPVAVALLAVLAAPVYWDRFCYYENNTTWLRDSKTGYDRDKDDFNAVLGRIRRLPPGRVYPGRRENWGENFKIGHAAVLYYLAPEELPAISSLPFTWALPGDFTTQFDQGRPAHFDLFNLRYVIAEPGSPLPAFVKEKKIGRHGRFLLYQVRTTGYFALVRSPLAVYGDKNSVWNLMTMWLRSRQVENKQYISIFFDRKAHPGYRDYIILDDRFGFWRLAPGQKIARPPGRPESIYELEADLKKWPAAGPFLGVISAERAGKNEFSARVKAGQECFLLFKMTYHPGWHAYVDGVEREKVMLSPGLLGVPVAAGAHDVKFVYRAPRWKAWLLLAGLAAVAGLFIWERRRRNVAATFRSPETRVET
ncbi:MAG: hypothetical protein JW873_06595 [Candidatus Saganbacteria bacterium]|nr:hypothetical protein [Candidatus Saganbacteria bacterium]